MKYLPISDNAARQVIDAATIRSGFLPMTTTFGLYVLNVRLF